MRVRLVSKINDLESRETICEVNNEENRNNKNINYINARGRLCTATPPLVNRNRTPPPPSQKHHFTQKHQINFCDDENPLNLDEDYSLPNVSGIELTLVPNLIFVIMAQVIVNLKRVQVFESENGSNVNLVFNESIKGFERRIGDDGSVSFEEADVNHISIPSRALTAQLCDLDDTIALYRGTMKNNSAFGQKEFTIALFKAVLTLERTLHTAGEVYGQDENGTDLAHQRDCYTTEVVDIKLSEKSVDLIMQKLLAD